MDRSEGKLTKNEVSELLLVFSMKPEPLVVKLNRYLSWFGLKSHPPIRDERKPYARKMAR